MNTQETIDFNAAVARIDDPKTSHEAAASVTRITATQYGIWNLLALKPSTDSELIARYQNATLSDPETYPKASESGIRSRRAELTRLGSVVDSGERRVTPSGRQSIVWKVPQPNFKSVDLRHRRP